MATKLKSEKRKQILVISLFGVMGVVLIYQLFFSSPPPKPKAQASKPAQTPTSRGATTVTSPDAAEKLARRQTDKQQEQAEIDELLKDLSVLDLHVIRTSGPATIGQRGNIFDYYIPPPPPPPKQPDPPPITVSGVTPQNATAGTPRGFTLTIFGKGFPADAQIIIEGRQRPTKRVNETTLTTEMAATDYASPRSMGIEVKSQSDPVKLYSNQITFTATPAPEPPFRFIGILGEQALLEVTSTKEYIRVQAGGVVKGVWKVDAISVQAIDVTHTQFSIKKRVPLQATGR